MLYIPISISFAHKLGYCPIFHVPPVPGMYGPIWAHRFFSGTASIPIDNDEYRSETPRSVFISIYLAFQLYMCQCSAGLAHKFPYSPYEAGPSLLIMKSAMYVLRITGI